MKTKYFLYAILGNERVEREVSVEEYCKSERIAGFRPKLPSTDPEYMKTPATAGFSDGNIGGRISYEN